MSDPAASAPLRMVPAIVGPTGAGKSALAVALGWYDQSHFSRDFRRVLGTAPGEYAERARTTSAPAAAVVT